MAAAANTGPSGFPEIEFRLFGGRVRAFGRVWAPASEQGQTIGNSAESELDLSHVSAILKSISDGVRQLEAELPRTLADRDAAFRRVARASRLPLSPFMSWRLPALRAKLQVAEGRLGDAVARRNACWTALRFTFGHATLAAFRNVATTFAALEAAKTIWVTTTEAHGTLSGPVSGAQLQRQVIRTAPTLPEHVDSDWPGLTFRHPVGSKLELYPGFAIIGAGADAKLVSLLDVHLAAAEAIVAEVIEPPADAVMVTRVWEKANKDGSPDRRYANNRSMPIVRYGLLRFSAPGMTAVSYLVSNPNAARSFATAFAEYRQRMEEEAALQTSTANVGVVARATLQERATANVPPPPVVGRAHEYTVAALVACAMSGWLLVTGPFGDQAAIASDAGLAHVQMGAPPRSPAPAMLAETTVAAPSVATPEPRPATAATTLAVPRPEATAPQERERIVVRPGGANIRSAPNGSADVLRTASSGTHLNVFGRSSGWVRVGDAEAWGWIHSSLLESGN